MKRAVVVGSRGQDGRYLMERLAADHVAIGVDVGGVEAHGFKGALPARADVRVRAEVDALLAATQPDALYYLAAHHHSAEERPDDGQELEACLGVNVQGLVNVLDALKRHAPACRVFYAGSSHMFGRPETPTQSEKTPYAPKNPYAITKVAGAHTCALYRERAGMHVSVGILYNHESPFRGPQFVTQRIVRGARAAAKDASHRMTIGSLSATVDWGWAPDFVDAMLRITAQPKPDDYVIATGIPHTVEDFVAAAFGHLKLDWTEHVREDPSVVKGEKNTLIGDATKLRAATGWKPTVSFEEMVRMLVEAPES
jgi:GDPmannose 4,6-dehydratase